MAVPIFVWNGTAWESTGPTIPASPIKYQASAPTSPSTGDIWVDSDADVTSGSQQFQRFRFVASGGETTISGADANGAVLAYTAGAELVVLNGSTLVRGQDYTATNGTSITGLSPALVANDVLEVFSFIAFNVANTYTQAQVDGLLDSYMGSRLIVPTSVVNGTISASGGVTFSSASSVSLNGVFSSTYENYKIVFTTSNFSASDALSFRLRASGSDYSSANYSQMGTRNFSNGATIAALNESGRTSIGLGSSNSAAGDRCGITIDIFKPNVNFTNKVMHITIVNQDSTGLYLRNQGGLVDGGTYVFDGFSFIIASGNMSGTVRVYGYKN